MRRFFTAALLFIISGCAVSPISTIQEKNKITVTLSGQSNNYYGLFTGNGRFVAEDNGRDGFLVFSIPEYVDASQCFTVLSRKSGKSIYEGNQYFSAPLISELRQAQQEARSLADNVDRLDSQIKISNDSYNNGWATIRRNRAFDEKASVCRLPNKRTIPAKPYAKCSSETQCKEDGAAICFTRYLGVEGCAVAAKKLGLSGFLSSPGCSATAARLAGDTYGLGDAFVDALKGAIDDTADDLTKSDSWWDNFWGYAIKTYSLVSKVNDSQQCTSNFIEKNYAPVREWLAEVKAIEAEPQATLNQCLFVAKNINSDLKNTKELQQKRSTASAALSAARERQSLLYGQNRPVSICSSSDQTHF